MEPKDYWGFEGKAYVTEDGNYGNDIVIIFKADDLTEEQWEQVGSQTDSDRIVYIKRILDGEDVSDMEE
jgi:hypothetical protein